MVTAIYYVRKSIDLVSVGDERESITPCTAKR